MFVNFLKCAILASIFLAGASQVTAQSNGYPYQVIATTKQGRAISPVGASTLREAENTAKYLRSLGNSNVRIQERYWSVTPYSLDKRWNGRGYTYFYKAESTFENQDKNRVIRFGQGFVDADRRTITLNGSRYPYRKYDGPSTRWVNR